MGWIRTPEPDEGPPAVGCWVGTLLVLGASITAAVLWRAVWPLVPALLAGFFLSRLVYGKVLLLLARASLTKAGKLGIVVYSDSPNWQEYVQEEWLPRLADRFVVLNWSERRLWKRDVAVRLFDHYLGRSYNYNPAVLLLRGLREPYAFRFYFAFRDAKHGNREALERLETRLWAEIEEHLEVVVS